MSAAIKGGWAVKCDRCRGAFRVYAQNLIGEECREAQQSVYFAAPQYARLEDDCDGTLRLVRNVAEVAS